MSDAPTILDAAKLTRWMNARKLTPHVVAQRSGIAVDQLMKGMTDNGVVFSSTDCDRVAATLDVGIDQLTSPPSTPRAVIIATAEDIEATRRGIQRDGIHFYDYYTLPVPHGEVGPVLLDIYCPATRTPALNSGHIEPAITLNLGPGDIHGRWSEELAGAGWGLLRANAAGDRWIVGDSYIEPSYCPHSYARAGDAPARIISYTAASSLAALVERSDRWPTEAFDAFMARLHSAAGPDCLVLASALNRRGWHPEVLAERAGVPCENLVASLEGDARALRYEQVLRIADLLGTDYRMLLPAVRRHDVLGKSSCTIEDSRRTVRPFRSYTVASMASAPHLPDLVGLFLSCNKDMAHTSELDLLDEGDSHLLVTNGELTLSWSEDDAVRHRRLRQGDCAWIGPFIAHGVSGRGAAVKLGSGGRGLTALDQAELTRTFDSERTLRRARRDTSGWGYDPGARAT